MLLATVALAAAAPVRASPPARIMSANLCTDLMLLMLVPRQRIASISWLAHPMAARLLPGADAGIPVNHGMAEDVARDRPDLILVGTYSTPVMRRLAAEVGARIVAIDPASSFADIRRALRQMGDAVGAAARADALIARVDATLAAIRPSARRHVIVWTGGDAVPGRGTLADAIVTAAGAVNVAGGDGYTSFGLEELLAARPDALLLEASDAPAPSLHDRAAAHPLLARAFRGRTIDMPAAWYGCGLPQSAETARALADALRRLPPERAR